MILLSFNSGKFEFETLPTLMFFKAGEDTGTQYRGPFESRHLIDFINEQIGRKNKRMVSVEEPF